MTAGLIGLGIIVGLYLIGRAIGNGGNPSTITVGSNNTDTRDCTELCNQWDNRRQERCNAEKDEGTAQNRVGTLNSQLLAAIAAAATASAALVACLASVFCAPFAPGIAALAAVLWAAVLVTAGQL